jgi:hypothetical protein
MPKATPLVECGKEAIARSADALVWNRHTGEGFQNVGSCCGSVVFVDQATESITTLDLASGGLTVRVGRFGREQSESPVRAPRVFAWV